MVDYAVTFATGAAVGVLLEKFVFAKMQESGIKSRREALETCFGEGMSATKLTFTEVKEWIQARKDKLEGGAKAAVAKVDKNTMKTLGQNLDTRDMENYLVLAIMSAEGKVEESLLIKYESLDQELENALAKGNGVMVVRG